MRASFSGFSTALSALQANQKRLDLIGQNLANMNTPGYTRQQLQTSSLGYTSPIGHLLSGSQTTVGYGVSMDSISQIRNPYLDAQYRSQMSKASYTDSVQSALDSLSSILDESSTPGLRAALADIQSTLTAMQSSEGSKDPVTESELRSRMQALTNMLNSSANHIDEAQKSEFDKLNGEGTSEQGAVQKVNDILRQVGDLNIQIKQNQIMGQPSLELMDQRNFLMDQLASYVPIEVSYVKDPNHTGTYNHTVTHPDGSTTTEVRDRMYEYDANGNILGKKEWPDDVKVDLVYTDNKGVPQRLTLVNGSEGGKGNNYGSLEMTGGSRTDPTDAAITFNGAASSGGGSTIASASESQFKNGTIQASLDMLGKAGTGGTIPGTTTIDNVRGYQFYMNKLDTLAQNFAQILNDINKDGVQGNPAVNTDPYYLLVNKGNDTDGDPATDPGTGITAANIGISSDWTNGNTHVGTLGDSPTDTILNMLNSFSQSHAGLDDKSFTDFVNNTSSLLANDSSANKSALKTDVTVLNSVQNSRDSISGVSLDEEASNMMNCVSAYNAASRLMTALDEVLNTLINSTGLVGR